MDDIRRTRLQTLAPFFDALEGVLTDVRSKEGDVRDSTSHSDKKQFFFSLLVAEAYLVQAKAICEQVGSVAPDLAGLEELVGAPFTVNVRRARRAIDTLISDPASEKDNLDWLSKQYNFGLDDRGEPQGLSLLGGLVGELTRPEHRELVFFAAMSFFSERQRRRPSGDLRPPWLSVSVLHDFQRALPIWTTIQTNQRALRCRISISSVTDVGIRAAVTGASSDSLPEPEHVAAAIANEFGLPSGSLVAGAVQALTKVELEEAHQNVPWSTASGFTLDVSFYRRTGQVPDTKWVAGQIGPTGIEIPPPPSPPRA